MKLIVQIPCLNEAETLHTVIQDIPQQIPGIDVIETLVVDDGSTDNTAAIADRLGVDHIVRHNCNRGLAAAFTTGVNSAISLGADIIVNTDGDHQYPGGDIARLVEPILNREADLVIGDRQPGTDLRYSWIKRFLQRLGSRIVGQLAGQQIKDAVSGFRAFSREAASRLEVVTDFSYTIETVLQASHKGLAIKFVPIKTNNVERPSRLFRNIPHFVYRSGLTMLRVFFLFRPLSILIWLSGFLAVVGGIPVVRFLVLWALGNGDGHIQSLVLSGVLLILSCLTLVAGLISDLIATNRRLLEATSERIQRLEARLVELGDTEGQRDMETAGRSQKSLSRDVGLVAPTYLSRGDSERFAA